MAEIPVLALASPRWVDLAPDYPMLVPDLLARLRHAPNEGDWAEAYEQCVHQRTLSRVAYAAVPHLLRLACVQNRWWDPWFLFMLGWVAAPTNAPDGPVPADLADGFRRAVAHAARLSMRAIRRKRYDERDFTLVLSAAANLNGRPAAANLMESLATSLIFNLFVVVGD